MRVTNISHWNYLYVTRRMLIQTSFYVIDKKHNNIFYS